jgi:pimeloyl-ACP methyl ester carboxylesterase
MLNTDLRARREAIVREHLASENAYEFHRTIATFEHPRYELVATGVGSEDAVLPPRYSRELVELLPNARLKIIDDAGHKSFQEQPAIFNDLVREFLAPRDAIVA